MSAVMVFPDVDLAKVAQVASAFFVAQAEEAGRANLIPGNSVYSPADVAHILKAAEEVAGDGEAGAESTEPLKSMRAEVEEARQEYQRVLREDGPGWNFDCACRRHSELKAKLEGVQVVLGEEAGA